MQSLTQIKELLAARGLAPRKQFGQNFLADHNLIRKLVDASGVRAGDLVLEIGPGTGTLTEELLSRGCRVVAAEVDHGLCALLRERFGAGQGGFELVEGDCLDGKRALSPELTARLGGEPFVLVSNLPYGAGTPVMTVLLAQYPRCRGMSVTIQREVAQRLTAGAGGEDYGPLAILVAATARVEPLAVLPPECFWPRPEVTSAMVAVRRLEEPKTPDPRGLFDFAQRLFEKRRKQLGTVLGRDAVLPPGISPHARAESLSVPEVLRLFASVGSSQNRDR